MRYQARSHDFSKSEWRQTIISSRGIGAVTHFQPDGSAPTHCASLGVWAARNLLFCWTPYDHVIPSLHDRLLLLVADLDNVFAKHFLCGPRVQLLVRLGDQVTRWNPSLSVGVVQHPAQPPIRVPAVQDFHHVAFFQRQTILLARYVLGNGDVYRKYLHTNMLLVSLHLHTAAVLSS